MAQDGGAVTLTPYPRTIKITRCWIMILVKVQFISPGGSGLVSQVAGPLSLDALTLLLNMALSTDEHEERTTH